jgi:hypothetical protein
MVLAGSVPILAAQANPLELQFIRNNTPTYD